MRALRFIGRGFWVAGLLLLHAFIWFFGWLALLLAWVLAWVPHGVIGIGFAIAGSNQPSIDLYRAWGSRWTGFVTLASGGLVLLLHVGLSVVGFVSTGLALRRDRQGRRDAEVERSA